MSNETKKTALPKLRFPEFREEEWKTESFEDLYSFKGTNSFSRDKLTYDGGTVKNIHYGDIHTKFSTLFDITKEKVPFIKSSVAADKLKEENYCVEGDMLFADASEDLNDIGKSIEIVNLNGEKVLAGLHTQFARQKEQKLEIGFAGYLFMSDAIRAQIQNESQGTKVLGISAGRLSKIEVSYPNDKREQQKIAASLSSLDDLFTAQTAQLTALQAHKRGLMQALFPAEGETVPKLRFQQFQQAGEWKKKSLGEVCKMQAGKFVSAAEIFNTKQDCLFPCYGGNGLRGYTKSFTHDGRYSLIGRQGALCGNITLAKGKFHATEHAVVVTPKHDVDTDWLFHQLNLSNLNQYATGQAQPGLSVENLEKVKIQIPDSKLEQEKIASCLSNADRLIKIQHKRINSLRLHKKALMQNLFPTSNNPE